MDKVIVCETLVLNDIVQESGVNPNSCYQCGKCSAGCSLAFAMDYLPSEILRLLQSGKVIDVLNSKTIWLCQSCAVCSRGCPQNIDLAKLIRTLCIVSQRRGNADKGNKYAAFHQSILDSVKEQGRVNNTKYVLGSLIKSNVATNLRLGLSLALKGKLRFKPAKIVEKGQLSNIFARTLLGGGKDV